MDEAQSAAAAVTRAEGTTSLSPPSAATGMVSDRRQTWRVHSSSRSTAPASATWRTMAVSAASPMKNDLRKDVVEGRKNLDTSLHASCQGHRRMSSHRARTHPPTHTRARLSHHAPAHLHRTGRGKVARQASGGQASSCAGGQGNPRDVQQHRRPAWRHEQREVRLLGGVLLLELYQLLTPRRRPHARNVNA